jgi:hypothetical protein
LKSDRSSLVRRSVGFSLIVTGLLLFGVLPPILVQQGVLGLWILIWLAIGCIGLGSLLFVRVGLRHTVKVLLIVLGLFVPWSAIFFISLPDDSQFLLALFIAVIAFPVCRHYAKRGSLKKSSGGA